MSARKTPASARANHRGSSIVVGGGGGAGGNNRRPGGVATPRTLIRNFLHAAPTPPSASGVTRTASAATAVAASSGLTSASKASSRAGKAATVLSASKRNNTPRSLIRGFLAAAETPVHTPRELKGAARTPVAKTPVSNAAAAKTPSPRAVTPPQYNTPDYDSAPSPMSGGVTPMSAPKSASSLRNVVSADDSVDLDASVETPSPVVVPTRRSKQGPTFQVDFTPDGRPPIVPTRGAATRASTVAAAAAAGKKTRTRSTANAGPGFVNATIMMGLFEHFSPARVSKDSVSVLSQISSKFLDQAVTDIEAFAKRSRRSTIDPVDVESLLKKQRFVTDQQSVQDLVRQHMPMELQEELIPIARAFNNVS